MLAAWVWLASTGCIDLEIHGERDAYPRGRWVPSRESWVRAPGFAWTRTVIDDAVGGEHVVELRPGGDVRVQLLGAGRKWTAALHLIRIDEPRALRRSVWPTWHPELPLDLEGLPQGEYRLEVWGSELLAQTTFSVGAGESTRIELEIAG